MSWFSGVQVDDIPDNPNDLPNNTYKFSITSAMVKPTKDNSKTGITFKYQIVEGPWASFFPIIDWVRVPDGKTPADEVERILSYIKMRLLAFGFSVEEIQEFGPEMVDECVNRQFYGTTSSRTDKTTNQTNIRVVKFDPLSGDNDDDMLGGSSDEPVF